MLFVWIPLPSCRFAAIHPLPTLSLARHLSPAGESLSKGTATLSVCSLCSQPAPPKGELLVRRPQASSPSQSPAVTDSPFCRCATSSPGAGEVFPQRESPWHSGKVIGLKRKAWGSAISLRGLVPAAPHFRRKRRCKCRFSLRPLP